jgi:hypothetical protein
MRVKILIVLSAILSFTACTKEKTVDLDKPEKVLKAYIEDRFNNVKSTGDRGKLVRYTTGKVKTFLEKMTDQEFTEKFLSTNMTLKRYRVITKKSTGDGKAQVTYEIAMETANGDSKDKVSNKKVAVFDQVSDDWLISEVKNLKTTIVLGEQSVVLDSAVP